MTNRDHLMCLAAATALVAFSGISRADDNYVPNTDRFARSEITEPMTCAQARAFAWFKHQMELTDGTNDTAVEEPEECVRTYVAKSPEPGVYEESK